MNSANYDQLVCVVGTNVYFKPGMPISGYMEHGKWNMENAYFHYWE